MTKLINMYVLQYPGAMKNAVYGVGDFLEVTNSLLKGAGKKTQFSYKIIDVFGRYPIKKKGKEIIYLPPALSDEYYLEPNSKLLDWIKKKYKEGALISSSCAGLFILAESGIIKDEVVTTHWALGNLFQKKYPEINLNTDQIILNHDKIITSGGMMTWQDLTFHIVNRFVPSETLSQLGKYLIVDPPQRDQKKYVIFAPNKEHGDAKILNVQKYIEKNFSENINVSDLSNQVGLGSRTFLRRFKEAVGLTPLDYLQRVRILKSQLLLEDRFISIDQIAYEVGYSDVGAFRKIFKKKVGLSPSEFRKHWI